MENRIIVATFDNEDAAFETAQDAQDLERSGVIKIKRGAILTKDANGILTAPDTRNVGRSWGPFGEEIIGALPGALRALLPAPGGVSAGAPGALGGATGGLTVGAAGDALPDTLGHEPEDQFLHDAISGIEPGQTVLVAELEEDSTDPIDTAVTRRGGRLFRTNLEVTGKVEQVRRRVQRGLTAVREKIEHDIEANEAQMAWENDTLIESDIKVGRLMTINQQSEYDVYANLQGPASTRPVDDRLP